MVERDAQSDLDVPSGDADFVDDEAEQLLLLIEVEAVECGGSALRERVDASTEPVVLGELSPLVGQRVTLRVDIGPPGVELFGSALELDEFDEPGLVEVGEATALVVRGFDLPVEAGELRVEQFVIGCRRAFGDGLFAGEEHLGPQQRFTHLLEHEGVEVVGADVALIAALVLAPGPQRVVVAAVVVAVERAVAPAHLVADHANSAGAAADHAAQQPRARLGPARAPLRVVPADPAGGFKDVLGDDDRHRDLHPVLSGPGHLTAGASGTWVGHGLSLVEIHPADVGLVAEQPPDGGRPPHRLARGRRYPVGVETAGDLARGVPAGDVVVEDPPHHFGLGLEHLEVRGSLSRAGKPPVSVGRLPRDDLARTRAPQLAAAVAFGDLGPLVFGDHALNLREQPGLRVVVDVGGVGEEHGHTEAGELLEHDDLVRVDAGQPVRRQAPQRVDEPGLRRVAQRVEPRTVEARAGVAVVEELGHNLVALCRNAFAQRGDLGADGSPGLLGLGGHAGVDCHSHWWASFWRSGKHLVDSSSS